LGPPKRPCLSAISTPVGRRLEATEHTTAHRVEFVREGATHGRPENPVFIGDFGRKNGETRTRTGDTTIFSRVLYQLSYLAATAKRSD